jgi:hypothetical protein
MMSVYKIGCYICEDPSFATMGLPLCYPCKFCQGHVAADDTVCDACGREQQDINLDPEAGLREPFEQQTDTIINLDPEAGICKYCGHIPCGCGG